MLNVRPTDLLSRAASMVLVERRSTREPPALRQVPPSWRACRLTMPHAYFFGIVGAWIGALAILLAVVLTVGWS